jgi:catechol 2,3-dioxygenase-like lactoylglutathione lyase family enzyme
MIPAKDLAGTRHWYEDVLGLAVLHEDPVSVACGLRPESTQRL